VTCIASIGKNAILRSLGACNQQINAVIPKDGNISEFLYYLFCYNKKVLLENAGTTATSIVSKSTFKQLQFAVPEPLEQNTIADILSDVDALIVSLEKLIAKKRAIKTSAMQQLLTGKKRLPGFSGQWKEMRLREIGQFLKGSGVRKDDTLSGNIPCIRYGEIYTHHNDYIRAFYSWISPEVASTATRIKRGDILFAGSGETKEEIGKCVAFLDDIEAYAGGDIVILRNVAADSLFLGYYLNEDVINRQKTSKGQGDAIVHISATALAEIIGKFPPVPEQTVIANILMDIDAEINAYELKHDKILLLKQGMMQELLTGRTRLV
jgi:type I restriction enzyme S subunit